MNSSSSELSWPTTTSHEGRTFCCFPRRRGPSLTNTALPGEPSKEVKTPVRKNPPTQSTTGEEGAFISLFNPNIPMTPNLARVGSQYVVDGFFFDSVQNTAYVTDRDGKAQVPFDVVINEPFVPTEKRKRLLYIGFQYPDGTSLSYVPVRDVILQHRSNALSSSSLSERGSRKLSAMYGRDYVYLSIPRVVYYALIQMAENAFRRRDDGAKCLLPDAEVRGERVWLFNTEMKASCKVEGWSYGRRYAKTVTQALKEMGGNLEGDALLFMRFCEELHGGDPEMKLQFRLHRMMVKGVSRY